MSCKKSPSRWNWCDVKPFLGGSTTVTATPRPIARRPVVGGKLTLKSTGAVHTSFLVNGGENSIARRPGVPAPTLSEAPIPRASTAASMASRLAMSSASLGRRKRTRSTTCGLVQLNRLSVTLKHRENLNVQARSPGGPKSQSGSSSVHSMRFPGLPLKRSVGSGSTALQNSCRQSFFFELQYPGIRRFNTQMLGLQFESQPSPSIRLPSSHCSLPVTMPFPQPVGVQFESQPSPSMRLPSSHFSLPSIVPLPQDGVEVGVTVGDGVGVGWLTPSR